MQSTILERLSQRVPLRVDVEESRLASKARKALSKIKSYQIQIKRLKNARGGLNSMGARGVYVKDCDMYFRSVIFKAKYVKNNGKDFSEKIKTHLYYITREEAGLEGQKAELFSNHDSAPSISELADSFSKSPHNFRFIISPENGDKLDLKEFTKELIEIMEKDLGTKLNWVASCHYDTNNPHIHLVVDGRDDREKKLLIRKDYMSRGIRNRASQISTYMIGLKTKEEIYYGMSLSTSKNSKTYLDEVIQFISTNSSKEIINTDKIKYKEFDFINKTLLEERLYYLESKGLSTRNENNCWTINKNYPDILKEIGRTNSIIERLSQKLSVKKEQCQIISRESLPDKGYKGRVVSHGFTNEIDEIRFLVIKTEDNKYLYLELGKYSEKTPSKTGDWVHISATKPSEGPRASDRNIVQLAQKNNGIYDVELHQTYAHQQKKLPPGVSVQEYGDMHLKRLEILHKMDLVKKISDKKFRIPDNLIEKITSKTQSKAKTHKPHIRVEQIPRPTLSSSVLSKGLKR